MKSQIIRQSTVVVFLCSACILAKKQRPREHAQTAEALAKVSMSGALIPPEMAKAYLELVPSKIAEIDKRQKRSNLPMDVPPVLGKAVVSVPKEHRTDVEWTIRLTVPKVTWDVIGEMVPKRQWPELKVDVEETTLTLNMGGPFQLAPSRVVDMKGKVLTQAQTAKRLKTETPVLVSVSGRMPDAYYLQLTKSDALIVILGPRDGCPAPKLLPSRAAPAVETGKTKK